MILPLATIVQQVPLGAFLGLGLTLFIMGVVGVLIRRNPVVVFMCIELMLNSVNLILLSFARYLPSGGVVDGPMNSAVSGQMMVIFVMAIAAAEVAVGLGIIMAIFRSRNEVDIDDMSLLKS